MKQYDDAERLLQQLVAEDPEYETVILIITNNNSNTPARDNLQIVQELKDWSQRQVKQKQTE